MAEKFVRLFPVNPRQKRTVASYTFRGQRYMGGFRPTWYKVSSQLADALRDLRQDHTDPYSPALFDIMDEEAKQTTERREQEQYLAQIGAIQGVISVPQDVKAPPTHDIRSDREKVMDGRSAAVPPARQPTQSATKTASIAPDPVVEAVPASVFPEVPIADVGPVTSKEAPKGRPTRRPARRMPQLPGAAVTSDDVGDGDSGPDGVDD
jgi:hypothetical protein